MTTVNIHEAKTHFASLLQRALNGEEIVVAKHGHPLVRLVPVNPLAMESRRFGRRNRPLTEEAKANAMAEMDEELLGDWSS
jgi:prevent-host-death family protein